MSEGADEILHALQQDLRKPALEAWNAEIGFIRQDVKLSLKNLRKWMRPERVATPIHLRPAKSRIVREPLGVVLIIAPWNYPVQLLLGPLVGAIAAGNCAALKPSEITAHTSGVLAKLVRRYMDPECIALFEGGVPETQALLAERFDHIFYTGNGSVAREVMAAAARHLTPVTLELGGKSPCIVDRDADLEVAARRIAWGKFMNAGQTCIAPDYVLVHQEREAELIDALAPHAARVLRRGSEPQPGLRAHPQRAPSPPARGAAQGRRRRAGRPERRGRRLHRADGAAQPEARFRR